jgi:DNA-binding XRE family transcriptional regulator
MKNFLVIDTETLGTKPDSVILSLGAYFVDVEKDIPSFDKIVEDGFYMKFDAKEQIDDGRTVDKATLEWWEKEGDVAKDVLAASDNDVSYTRLFEGLNNYLKGKTDYWIFARSPSFDFTVLDNIRNYNNIESLWPFYHEKDIRTFLDTMLMVLPFEEQWNKFNLPKELWPSDGVITSHHALYDVATDIKRMEVVLELYAKLKIMNNPRTYTIEEIAEEIGSTTQTVKNIEKRAINKIKPDLTEFN